MRRCGGFTILELLLMLLLVSAVAAITIPAFFRHPIVTLENASVLLAHDLRAAQNRSAYMAEASLFHFFEDGDGYHVTNLAGEVIRNPSTSQEFVRHYSADAVFHGVRIIAAECGEDRSIPYDDRGRALEAIRVTLEFEGDQRVVEVRKGSGKISIIGSTSSWVDNGY